MNRRIRLYTSSGTGNTYRLGCWIRAEAEKLGQKTDLIMIDREDPKKDVSGDLSQLIGLLFPVHGFMPPWSMIKFLCRLPSGNGTRVFCAATRGGLKIGPLPIPGIAGFATFMAAIIAFLKGYRVCGLFSLDMPSNFINFHWGLHKKTITAIQQRARRKLALFVRPILSGKRLFLTLNNAWELFWTVLILWFIPFFPILYLLIGKLFMAKLMFSNSKCNACGICEKFCPNHGIEMRQAGSTKRPFWTYHCETCLRCMGYCPKKAIEAGHSWGVMLCYITGAAVFYWLLGKTPIPEAWQAELSDSVFGQILQVVYLVIAMLAAYRVFWLLNRIPLVNKVFTLTTLTHYYRRFHDPDTRLKDLKPGQ